MDSYSGFGISGKLVYCQTNQEGQYHSHDGEAAFKLENGIKFWMKNGIVHNKDGPAITFPNGDELWIQNGLLHRTGGPSLVSKNKELYSKKGRIIKNPNRTK
jgi:hypothetical protein